MADDGDRSSEDEILFTRVSLANQAARAQKTGESLRECLECGDEIPEGRRLAEPGCEYCVDCQSWLDKRGRFYP